MTRVLCLSEILAGAESSVHEQSSYEVTSHHNVGFHTDDSSSQLDVRLEETLVNSRREFGLEISSIPGHRHSRLKVSMLRIVEGFQLLGDRLALRVVVGWDIFEGLSGS